MSRDMYGSAGIMSSGAQRSPKPPRREMPMVGQGSPSKPYPGPGLPHQGPMSSRGSPIAAQRTLSPQQSRKGRHGARSSNNSPLTLPTDGHVPHSLSSSAFNVAGPGYYADELGSPLVDNRAASAPGHHRSRSAGRAALRSYQSLERDPEREFVPIRDVRDRSLERRDRSLERHRDVIYDEDPYSGRGHQSPNPDSALRHAPSRERERDRDREAYVFELQTQLAELQKEYHSLKKELEVTNQKLGSSMHSIKTFWSPELKKERALRKEESAKYSLINDQLKLLNSENQKQATLIQQLEEELRSTQMRNPNIDLQPQLEALYAEKEHQAKEIYLLRETIKELELRIDTQKQTLQARDESIKKLLEMLQAKGSAGKLMDEDRLEYERMKTHLFEAQARARHMETLMENKDKDIMKTKEIEEYKVEISKRDQEIMAMGAKMRTLEEQHQDYQRHIAVLKESLTAKEEHYNMLQTDVEELRQRLEEKNKLIEKKTEQMMTAQQDRNRLSCELNEMKEHMDIKDRKINVLQRKVELHDANERAAGKAKDGDAQVVAAQKQIEERQKALDERQKVLEDMEKRLKKRKERLDELEAQMQMAEVGQNEVLAKQIAELRKKNEDLEKQRGGAKKELDKAKEDASRAQQDLDRLLQIMQQSEEEKFSKDKQIKDLQDALTSLKKTQPVERASSGVSLAEEARRKEEEVKREASKAQDAMRSKEERIEELEEALRESVRITAEREINVAESEAQARKIAEKVGKLEERLKSLQNAHNVRCTNCPRTKSRLQKLEGRVTVLTNERRRHLEELFEMKQDALTAAISERDAHVALLEVSGVKNQKSAEELERLKVEKLKLMDKIKEESEKRVQILQELSFGEEIEAPELKPNGGNHCDDDVQDGEETDD